MVKESLISAPKEEESVASGASSSAKKKTSQSGPLNEVSVRNTITIIVRFVVMLSMLSY